ncbi:MAG TPA: MtnX-like HAD-IB family phosphatase [Vicinamibacterales bacterium]|nr:MtnX-like HAD-IB family phosphatase [Vicinamibacterales bacterium]
MTPPAVVFLDFDGTITCRDVTDAILEQFADGEWQAVERDWIAGRIGSRECLARQMALVRAKPRDLDALIDAIEVDAGFPALAEACASRGVPLTVVSDGFDYCIRRVLNRPQFRDRLSGIGIVSSGLEWAGGAWRTFFAHPVEPCEHGCGTCKPAAMARLRGGAPIVLFAGDGLSDRHAAAQTGATVFAKNALARFCAAAAIPFVPYETLADVAVALEQVLSAAAPAASLKGV